MRAERKRLPRNRSGRTTHFRVGQTTGFLTCGEYEDGSLGELYINVTKFGSTLRGLLDCIAIMASHCLQYGMGVETVVEMLRGRDFEPRGMTDDPEIPECESIVDWIAQRLELDYCPQPTKETP